MAAEEGDLEVAAILCGLKRALRARDRRRRQQRGEEAPVVPSWGRRRLRSVLEVGKPAGAAERDGKPAGGAETDGKPAKVAGAASPDTLLAFPDEEEEEEEEEGDDDDAARKARAQAEWMQEQRVVVASLSQQNADLLKQIEEYRARLLSSRSANESLKQLHKVRRRQQQEEEHARRRSMRPGGIAATPNPSAAAEAALGLDLNEPADGDATAQEERFRQLRKAAEARRRRLGILRAKTLASPRPCLKKRSPKRDWLASLFSSPPRRPPKRITLHYAATQPRH